MDGTKYSSEQKKKILDSVCDQMVEGVSLRSILRSENMPPISTFFTWLENDKVMSDQYARAMSFRAMSMFEDIIDEAERDPERMDSKFGTCVDPGSVQDKRVRIDAKKWIASKLLPQKYGENLEFYEKLKAEKEKEQSGDNRIEIEIV